MQAFSSFPTDTVPPEYDLAWLYNGLADLYSYWLPPEAIETFRQGGFYTTEIQPGLRAIALNSMNCYTLNFWLMYHWEDPNSQLVWLNQALLEAERNGEKVYILSHIPSGRHDCLGAWGREYSKIIDRFEGTIANQFFGHTHNDQFEVYYDVETNSRPVGVSFITPAVSTWQDLNPSYRVYTADGNYDGSSRRVLNYDTYITNLIEANQNGPDVNPTFFKLYNALEALEMNSLLPREFDQLARRLAVDDQLWQNYYDFYNSGVSLPWTAEDRDLVVCDALTSSNIDERKCDEILGR